MIKFRITTMIEKDVKRIARLISILTQLQSAKLVTAARLAEKFSVSVRTIYRDIKVLEQAGVPVTTEEGKGYSLMEGYRLAPVMLNEHEANALITAEKLISRNKDASFVGAYTEAMSKIKAILRYSVRDKANHLSEYTYFGINAAKERSSNFLSSLQHALTNHLLVKIAYEDENKIQTFRSVEPFALVSSEENWLLLAWCTLREDYRFFRLDRIQKVEVTGNHFEPRPLTLQQYFQKYHGTILNP